MAICIARTDQSNHHDDVLRVLRQLVSGEVNGDGTEFCFDVQGHRYSIVKPSGSIGNTDELSLAIYNDLKLSQYIAEDDNLTTREARHFTLTTRGRQFVAALAD